MIQIYYDMGKGKTCSAVGQVMRMVGHGRKALFCQFIKDGSSGEIASLKELGVECLAPEQFNNIESNTKIFKQVMYLHFIKNYDIIVLDEGLDAMIGGAFSERELINLMDKCNIYGTELVITGHYLPESAILQRADYLTHFEKQKHPYDKGVQAREGVEY